MMEQDENRELTCREVVGLVTDYLEDALLPEMHMAVTEHMVGCSNCSAYYAQMQRTIVMLRQLAQEPAFPATKEALLQKFREWHG
jgi:predicted anti-sigma-YlaC factor YlaD